MLKKYLTNYKLCCTLEAHSFLARYEVKVKVNSIQIETYSPNAVNNAASKDYSILVNGEKFVVGANHAQKFGSKDAAFNGVTNNAATKKGYAVLINGERYVVGVSKNAVVKTSNVTQRLLDVFKKLPLAHKTTNNSLNIVA